MTVLVFEPMIPIALWLSLAVTAAGLLAWYAIDAARRLGPLAAGRIALLMGVALALPLTILLNPTWHDRVLPPAGKPLLTVLVDTSASMATHDNPDAATGADTADPGTAKQGSRFDEARRIAESIAAHLCDRYDVQLQTFATLSTPVEPAQLAELKPEGQFTDLAAGISGLLQADRPQGQAIVLLSDGIHNVGGEALVLEVAEQARALTAPIFTKTLGGETHVRDLSVEVQTPQDLAFVNQKIPIRVHLEAQGLSGAVARVSLRSDEREIGHQDVALVADQTTSFEFPVSHERSGVFRYEISVAPVQGEVTDANNNCTYVLRVIDEPIRVLLLEGKPYWDTKFLLRTLASDPSMEVVSIVRLAEGRYLQRTLDRPVDPNPPVGVAPDDLAAANRQPGAGDREAGQGGADTVSRGQAWQILPGAASLFSNADWLNSFQIIALGRDAESYLTDDVLVQLKRWLATGGGSLVCFRGTPTVQVNQRLGSLLPVRTSAARETRFHVKLTEAGKALGWIPVPRTPDEPDALSALPSLATRSDATDTRPLAVVFAVGGSTGGNPSPVVTSMPYGTGRVVVLEGAGMWRWAFMPPQYDAQEQLYSGLWQSLTRWLVSNTGLLPTQTWALRSDKVKYATTEPATASLLVRHGAAGNEPLTVELTGDSLDGARSLVPVALGDELDAYRVVFGRLPVGRYQAAVAGSPADDSSARTIFEVQPNVDEVLHVAANPGLMAQLSKKSGGSPLESASATEVATKMEEHLARIGPEQFRQTTAWDRWWVLLGVFALWGLAWGLRRNQGLV
ncbi:MAG TPA: vWA domain-containing protein [Pirellulales bacterium]|jgi:hypothetical protein